MAFWRFRREETQTFSDLVRGLQHSISAAMEMIEARNIELLSRYFSKENGDPVKQRLRIDEDTVLDVPLISIVNPSTLNVREVELDFSVRINQMELKQKQADANLINNDGGKLYAERIERSSINVSFGHGKDDSAMNVKIRFKAVPIPEGLSRIISEYDKTIIPRKNRLRS